MPRPWFEASPALAAAGLPPSPVRLRPAHPLARTLRMAGTPRFAFIPAAEAGTTQPRPIVQANLSALGHAIERRRGDRRIQLVEVEDFELEDRSGLFTAVQIFTLDMANDPDGLLGTAWLDGKGREALEPALKQARIHFERRQAA